MFYNIDKRSYYLKVKVPDFAENVEIVAEKEGLKWKSLKKNYRLLLQLLLLLL